MLTIIGRGWGGWVVRSFFAYLNAAAGTHIAVFHMKTRTGFGYR